jgi:hypothetical protein
MPWDNARPGTDPKYRSREHIAYTKALKSQLKRDGFVTCMAPVCVMPTRAITNPNGRHPDGLTAGHKPNGVDYNGGEHRACNLREAAVRARAKQDAPPVAPTPATFTTSRSWSHRTSSD